MVTVAERLSARLDEHDEIAYDSDPYDAMYRAIQYLIDEFGVKDDLVAFAVLREVSPWFGRHLDTEHGREVFRTVWAFHDEARGGDADD